jgi:ribosomal protein S26
VFKCKRCGVETPRLTVDQVHCVRCAVEVAAIIASDEKRRNRFSFAKALR